MKKHIIRIVTALLVTYTFSFMVCEYYEKSPWWKHGYTNNSDNGIIVAFSYNYPDPIPYFEEADIGEPPDIAGPPIKRSGKRFLRCFTATSKKS